MVRQRRNLQARRLRWLWRKLSLQARRSLHACSSFAPLLQKRAVSAPKQPLFSTRPQILRQRTQACCAVASLSHAEAPLTLVLAHAQRRWRCASTWMSVLATRMRCVHPPIA